jgi:hypothetical protein
VAESDTFEGLAPGHVVHVQGHVPGRDCYGEDGGGTVTVVDVVDVGDAVEPDDVGAAEAATDVPTGLRISL